MARDLYDSQIALHMAKGGRLGFAEMMLRELVPAGGNPAAPGAADGGERAAGDAAEPSAAAFAAPERNLLLARALWYRPTGTARLAEAPQAEPALKSEAMAAANPTGQPRRWSSPDEFVRDLMPAARRAAEALGTRPEAVLAVAALETGWGRHMPARSDGTPSNNLFGIKAHGWKGGVTRSSTLEFEAGRFQRKVEPFRSYASPEEAIADFASFISRQPRYAGALEVASEPESFLRALHQAGYATDPRYGDKLVAMLNSEPLKRAQLADAGANEAG
jgi:flagellar protein FlgJ